MSHHHFPNKDNTAAVAGALRFLLEMQRPDGLWYDFYTLAGQSNDWVSAVVASALARCSADDEGRSLCGVDRALLALTKRQRSNGGWSYNQKVPTDCDSTAWAMQALLKSAASKPSSLIRAARYLLRHQDPHSGGFSTYAPADRIDRFIGAQPEQTQGWLAPHLGVSCTSVEALLEAGADPRAPGIAGALRYIEYQRQPCSLWTCYWWCGYGYATYHALRALGLGKAIDQTAATEVSAAIIDSQDADGMWRAEDRPAVFETAMMLRSLQLLAHREPGVLEAMHKGRLCLLERQKQDGSFDAAPILRIPPPTVSDPHTVPNWCVDQTGTAVLVSDSERVFTTAATLSALALPCWKGM